MEAIKVVSNGSVTGTKVYDSAGKELQYVSSLEFAHSAGELPYVNLRVSVPQVTLVANGYISCDLSGYSLQQLVDIRDLISIEIIKREH